MVRRKEYAFPIINTLLLSIFTFLCLYPLLYIVFASFSQPDRLMKHTGILWHSLGFTFEGYKLALHNPHILSGYINTIYFVVVGTALNMIATAMGAYVLSRKDTMLGPVIMKGIVFTMYFSGGLIPLYLLVNNMHMNDTRIICILVSLISTWNLIVMRTSFQEVPVSLEESAKIDGAGPMTIFLKIFLPLSKPMLTTVTLFYAVGHWNEWFNHMIFLRGRDKFPLQLILREILITNDMRSTTTMGSIGTYTSDMYQVLIKYCTIVIATLPVLCIYPFVQKYFEKGVMVGAIKG